MGGMERIQKITPFLWFESQAEEAARFYTSVFPNSRVVSEARYGKSGPGPEGTVMTVDFELDGLRFVALNGGPIYKINEAVSFLVNCASAEEVDHYWGRLTEGGQEVQCGWLKDKFGLTWQIIPSRFLEMMKDPDPARKERVMKAMFQMKKLDLPKLEEAYRG
jgi:predicted 3-demethylubiquinone-9 3-methyltransferase (glyoxalase superfamily)